MGKMKELRKDVPYLIKDLGMVKNKRKVILECVDCGEQREARYDNLVPKCLKCSHKNNGTETHGMSRTKVYHVWAGMLQRTSNPKDDNYAKYKDRKPPEKWNTFSGFWEDMSKGYEEGLTIDRIDNDKPYSKDNCRWVTRAVQSANKGKQSNNSCGYKGVIYRTGPRYKNRYSAKIKSEGKTHYLGSYFTAKEAGLAYDKFVIENGLPHELNFKGDENG